MSEEYKCTNELLPDESYQNDESSGDTDCNEEFIKIENECLKELKDENRDSDTNCIRNSTEEAIPDEEQSEKSNTTYYSQSKSIKRSASASSSSAIEYAIAVAEACEGLDCPNDIENDLKSKEVKSKTAKSNPKPRPPVDEENMKKAIDDVLTKKLNITQAAKKYNLVKSTLWHRVGKQPIRPRRIDRQRPIMDTAICRNLSKGASLSATARVLGVSKTTVHRHKQQLIEMGALDNDILMNNPIQQRFTQAHRAYRVNGMSARFAAKFFSLPHTSVWRYIKRNEAAKHTKTNEENDEGENVEEEEEEEEEAEDIVVKSEEIEHSTVLKEIEINARINLENQLTFEINECFENNENTPCLENVKAEDKYADLEDEMIFEDELLIRILK